VVDSVKHALIKTIQLEQGNRPMQVQVAPDGSRAYVSTGRGGNIAVIDTATDEVVSLIATGGTRPWGIALSPDGGTLYSSNGPSNDVSVIDLATGTLIKKIPAGDSPWGVITLQPTAPIPR
jgi:YVTN family beta-propeller protein